MAFQARWGSGTANQLFRLESVLNTPLFAGFPGFVSKLWLAHDQRGVYRGLYEWDGAERATAYVRALVRSSRRTVTDDAARERLVRRLTLGQRSARRSSRRSSWALSATTIVDTLMSPAPTAGGRVMPAQWSAPPARGMAMTL